MTHNPWKIRKGFVISLALIFFTAALLFFIFFIKIPHSSTDTTHWKTYRNAQFGIEFKYPPQWQRKDDQNGVRFKVKSKDPRFSYRTKLALSCEKIIPSSQLAINYEWKKFIIIDGQLASQYDFIGDMSQVRNKIIIFQHNGYQCFLDGFDNNLDDMDNVLAIFKFIP